MKKKKAETTMLKVEITEEEKDFAKVLAKSKGHSMQWWIASLIRKELRKNPQKSSYLE